MQAAADAVVPFESQDPQTLCLEQPGGVEAGEAGADDRGICFGVGLGAARRKAGKQGCGDGLAPAECGHQWVPGAFVGWALRFSSAQRLKTVHVVSFGRASSPGGGLV